LQIFTTRNWKLLLIVETCPPLSLRAVPYNFHNTVVGERCWNNKRQKLIQKNRNKSHKRRVSVKSFNFFTES